MTVSATKQAGEQDNPPQNPMEGFPLLVATRDGLLVCRRDGSRCHRTLAGRAVTAVIAREGVILAGTAAGVSRSDDLGRTWEDASRGLKGEGVRWLAFHPDISDLELAGTAAGVFVSRDGARTWQPLASAEAFPWRAALSDGTVTAVTTMAP